MAKKQLGKFMAFTAIAGAAAAGISYILRYKSFHKELDEEFHDFEDDFDDDFNEFENEDTDSASRSYTAIKTIKETAEGEGNPPVRENETLEAEAPAENRDSSEDLSENQAQKSTTTIVEDTID